MILHKKVFLFFVLFFLSTPFLLAVQKPLQGDGVLRLYNYHFNEFAEIKFKKDGKIIPAEIEKINLLLRSRDNEEKIQIDLKLLDLIDHLQDYFQADTIEIISGYRRKEFNAKLLKEGHAVSPISLHTQGKAIDIHIDEIKEETIRDYLVDLKLGGVGYYGPLDFIHIDAGPARSWGEKSNSSRKLVGVLDPKNLTQLKSGKNDYFPEESFDFEWTTLPSSSVMITLEHFFRGKWNPIESYPITGQKWTLSADHSLFKENGKIRFGKYRWIFKLPNSDQILSSNEFYLKKK